MKIAFVSANQEKLPDPVIPFGILSVMSVTPQHHTRQLWDLCFESDPFNRLQREILNYRPDLVAISLRNLQNNDYSNVTNNLAYYDQLFKTLRSSTSAPLVVGGGGFSVAPEALMTRLKPDFGILGEGEHSFPALLQALEENKNFFSAIPSLCYFDGINLQRTAAPQRPIELNLLPPVSREMVDRRYYEAGIESFQTKRGCSLVCDYCTYPTIEGRTYRLKDPVRVVDEMEVLKNSNKELAHFFVVDAVFNIPPSHAKAICREMIHRNFNTSWTCYANPIGFDEELADLMVRAGCVGMEVGSDSGTDTILKKLRKGFNLNAIRRFHELSVQKGLKDCHTFILGTPGETLDDVRTTLSFITELNPYAAILMIWNDDSEAFESQSTPERQAFRQTVHDELIKQKDQFPYWVIPELGKQFNSHFFGRLRKRGLRGPLWQFLREGR